MPYFLTQCHMFNSSPSWEITWDSYMGQNVIPHDTEWGNRIFNLKQIYTITYMILDLWILQNKFSFLVDIRFPFRWKVQNLEFLAAFVLFKIRKNSHLLYVQVRIFLNNFIIYNNLIKKWCMSSREA
jgi:hypothetical protein